MLGMSAERADIFFFVCLQLYPDMKVGKGAPQGPTITIN